MCSFMRNPCDLEISSKSVIRSEYNWLSLIYSCKAWKKQKLFRCVVVTGSFIISLEYSHSQQHHYVHGLAHVLNSNIEFELENKIYNLNCLMLLWSWNMVNVTKVIWMGKCQWEFPSKHDIYQLMVSENCDVKVFGNARLK